MKKMVSGVAVAAAATILLAVGSLRAVETPLYDLALTSDTAWTLSIDDGPARPIKVTAGGWNSDQQEPQIPSRAAKDHVTYERQITIPAEARDKTTKIRFGGCNYGAEVWLDDQRITEHVAPMTPFEANLSGVATAGKTHRLRVKAYTRMHFGSPPNVPVGFDFNKDIPGVLPEYNMELKWQARWDTPTGDLFREGQSGPIEIDPGFHATRTVEFVLPPTVQEKRTLCLVLESVKEGKAVYREDRIRFLVLPPGQAGAR